MDFLRRAIIIAAELPGGFDSVMEKFNDIVFSLILPIIFGILGVILLIIAIIRCANIATAENEEAKKKAITKVVWFFIGTVLIFLIAFLMPVLWKYFSQVFQITGMS